MINGYSKMYDTEQLEPSPKTTPCRKRTKKTKTQSNIINTMLTVTLTCVSPFVFSIILSQKPPLDSELLS